MAAAACRNASLGYSPHAKEGPGCFVSLCFRAKRSQVPREGRRAKRGMQRSDDGETDKQQWGREGMRRKLPASVSSPLPR